MSHSGVHTVVEVIVSVLEVRKLALFPMRRRQGHRAFHRNLTKNEREYVWPRIIVRPISLGEPAVRAPGYGPEE